MIKKFYSFSLALLLLTILRINSIAGCITTQPTDQRVCAGTPAQFSVVASGTSITYQWQVYDKISTFVNINNDATYSGTTTSVLNVNTTLAMDGNQYRCIVTSSSCSPNPTISYYVNLFTKITVNPLNNNLPVCAPGAGGINVNATGSNLSYRWQIQGPFPGAFTYTDITDNYSYNGWIMMTGAHNQFMNIMIMAPDFNMLMGTKFRCIVYNGCEPAGVISTECQLVPMVMTNPPSSTSACVGGTAQFYAFTGATNTTITGYQWQVNTGSGYSDITDNAIYSNSNTYTLNINSASYSMNGYTYQLKVTSYGCGTTFSTPATLTVYQSPSISIQPADQTICSGVNTSFSVTASGSGLTYKWQVDKGTGFTDLTNDATYSGVSSNSLQITNPTTGMNGWQYRVSMASYCGSLSSNTAKLTVNPSVSITQPTNQTNCVGQAANFSVTATGSVQTYKWQVNKGTGYTDLANDANYSGVNTNSLQIATTDAAMNGYLYRVNLTSSCGNVSSNSATLTVNPAVTITQPTDQVICAGINTSFSVSTTGTILSYQWQVHKGVSYSDISDDTHYSGTNTNSLQITNTDETMDGWLYRVNVTTTCGAKSSQAGKLSVVYGPTINNISSEQNMHVGQPLLLSLTTYGNYLNYYWFKDNVSFTNQSNMYYVSSASIQDSGTYKAQISNTCGTTMFKYVHVTVTDIATQPTDNTSNEGQTLIFSVDTYQTPTSYQWQVDKGTGFENIVDGVALKPAAGATTYSGATTNQLTITNVSYDMNNYKYRCSIQTSGGDEYSKEATLTVNKTTGVNNATTTKLEVYPNPAQDYITLKNLQENAVVTIYNQQGVQIKSFTTNDNNFSITDISKGYYILEIEQNNMVARTPLVIK